MTKEEAEALQKLMEKRRSKRFAPSNLKKTKRIKNDNGKELIVVERVPFSSLSEDRDGDRFSEDGLKDMVEQINSSETGKIPCFADHGFGDTWAIYSILDMLGYWDNAVIEDGKAFADLSLQAADERAVKIAGKIDAGLPVSFSVGFIPHNIDMGKEDVGEIFNSTDLLEISCVGIPSNPDAVNMDSFNTLATVMAKSMGGIFKLIDKTPEELHMKLTKEQKAAEEAAKAAAKAAEDDEDEEDKQEGDDDTSDDDTGDDDGEALTAEKAEEIFRMVLAEELAPIKEALAEALDNKDKGEDGEDEEETDACDEDDKADKSKKPKAKKPVGVSIAAPKAKDGEKEKPEATKDGKIRFDMPV